MAKQELGKLEEIRNLYDMWETESGEFTPWLASDENIALLGEAVGIDIHVEETESPVGSFYADIYASEKSTGRRIIIENQLNETDHDHLGKLITYAAGRSADYIIWVAGQIRPEHRTAVQWLNQHTDNGTQFFLCEIRLFTINGSAPAVKFDVAASPVGWKKTISPTLLPDFWQSFQNYAFGKESFASDFEGLELRQNDSMQYLLGKHKCNISLIYINDRSVIRVSLFLAKEYRLFDTLNTALRESLPEHRHHFNYYRGNNGNAQERISVELSADLKNNASWKDLFSRMAEIMTVMKEQFTACLPQK